MRKIIAYIAMSLDGYIAAENGAVDWLGGDDSSPNAAGSYEHFYDGIDTVILGYSTYHQIVNELAPDNWPYQGKQSYVLTHKKITDTPEINFTDMDILQLSDSLKQAEGKNIWICGGANIINQFHNLGLIDEYQISIIPTILGKGIRLFEENNLNLKLKLLNTINYNGIVDLVYSRR